MDKITFGLLILSSSLVFALFLLAVLFVTIQAATL